MTLKEASEWMEKGVVIVDHNTSYIDDEQLELDIKSIEQLKPEEVRNFLKRLVPNYKPK